MTNPTTFNIPTSAYKENAVDLFQIYKVMKEIGFKDRELIIWVKKSISKNKFIVKQKIYGTWNPINPKLRNPIEAILVMNKNHNRLNCYGRTDLTTAEFLKWSYNLWEMDTESDRSHPAPYPIELPKRLIKLYTFPNQIVLDPFLGSGTTTKAAMDLRRNSIGIELNPKFVEMVKDRIGYGSVTIENLRNIENTKNIENTENIKNIKTDKSNILDLSSNSDLSNDLYSDNDYVTIDGIKYLMTERIP